MGFSPSARRWAAAKAGHRRHTRALGQARARSWRCGRCPAPISMSKGCRIRQPWRAQYSCRVRMISWKHVGLARAADGFDTGLPRSSEGLVFPRLKAVFAVRQNRCGPYPGQAPWPRPDGDADPSAISAIPAISATAGRLPAWRFRGQAQNPGGTRRENFPQFPLAFCQSPTALRGEVQYGNTGP